ncbi:response regulator transcription factor [Streptomyces sp. NPDC001667]
MLRSRQATPERLIAVIYSAARGEGSIPGDLLGHLLIHVRRLQRKASNTSDLPLSRVTERERQVLALASDGLSTAQIAAHMGYSQRTIKSLLSGVSMRFGLRNRTHAVAYAIRAGLI